MEAHERTRTALGGDSPSVHSGDADRRRLGSCRVRPEGRRGQAPGRRRSPGRRPRDRLPGRLGGLPDLRRGRGPGGHRGAGRPGGLRVRDRHRHLHGRQQGARDPGRPGPRRDHRRRWPAGTTTPTSSASGVGPWARPRRSTPWTPSSPPTSRVVTTSPAWTSWPPWTRPARPTGPSRPTSQEHLHDRQVRRVALRRLVGRRPRGRHACWARRPSASRPRCSSSPRRTSPRPAVLAASGSVLTNKYAEGYPGRRYYGGQPDHRRGRGPGPRAAVRPVRGGARQRPAPRRGQRQPGRLPGPAGAGRHHPGHAPRPRRAT